ncbi:hypothetical protein ATANTOWER_021868 [Ataeniobius toweri]|uniref:Uncharacterized protein n=1 Tax=Ataeniobius toweri TaxID=208326 RepID=A0ABU7A939_9TELE|nr:hypothetical protein [Ataeniobius toweri]
MEAPLTLLVQGGVSTSMRYLLLTGDHKWDLVTGGCFHILIRGMWGVAACVSQRTATRFEAYGNQRLFEQQSVLRYLHAGDLGFMCRAGFIRDCLQRE